MNQQQSRSTVSFNAASSMPSWRRRIFPSLSAFYRAVLKCIPDDLKNDNLVNSRLSIQPSWTIDESKRIPLQFDTPYHHSTTFFSFILEECLKNIITSSSEWLPNLNQPQASLWRKADVTNLILIDENKPGINGTTPNANRDPRLGRLYLLSIAVDITYSNKSHDVNNNNNSSTSFFMSGDLLMLQSEHWSRPGLGIVQGWEPDAEILRAIPTIDSEVYVRGDNRLVMNVVVCFKSELDDGPPGGFLDEDSVTIGTSFNILCLGNTTTTARESQALSSLGWINKELQDMIIRPPKVLSAPKSNTVSSTNSHSSISTTIGCPITVPAPLWTTLCQLYNPPQLRAIAAVCLSPPPDLTISNMTPIPVSVAESPITLLQGPPGTGKTRTIIAMVAVILAGGLPRRPGKAGKLVQVGASLGTSNSLKPNSSSNASTSSTSIGGNTTSASTSNSNRVRVLVCAPSNTAVDELVQRLLIQGVLGREGERLEDLSIVRIGKPGGFANYTRSLVSDSDTDERLGKSRGSNLDLVDSVSLEVLAERRRLASSLNKNESKPISIVNLRAQILETADIVCCTLAGAGSPHLLESAIRIPNFRFDAVIIDEAAQAVEPSSLIPLKFNPQALILVGDPHQLSATLFSSTAKNCGYGISLFQRLHSAGHPKLMLEVQYRLHPVIALYPSVRFYGNMLRTDPSVTADRSHWRPFHKDYRFGPAVFHDISYGTERAERNSVANDAEVAYIVQLYRTLKNNYPPESFATIGILAPYSAQKSRLRQAFTNSFGFSVLDSVEISTVDGFQGREKDVVIFSCTRAPGGGGRTGHIGFLREPDRLNVAITRAKFSLWIVGHADTLRGGDPEWECLVDFYRHQKLMIKVTNPDFWRVQPSPVPRQHHRQQPPVSGQSWNHKSSSRRHSASTSSQSAGPPATASSSSNIKKQASQASKNTTNKSATISSNITSRIDLNKNSEPQEQSSVAKVVAHDNRDDLSSHFNSKKRSRSDTNDVSWANLVGKESPQSSTTPKPQNDDIVAGNLEVKYKVENYQNPSVTTSRHSSFLSENTSASSVTNIYTVDSTQLAAATNGKTAKKLKPPPSHSTVGGTSR